MNELTSHSTLAHITDVTIESRHKCLNISGEEEGCYGCDVSFVHGGIPHGGACPPTGGAHGSSQHPWPEGGGGVLKHWPRWSTGGGGSQYPPGDGCSQLYAGGGGGGDHIKGYPDCERPSPQYHGCWTRMRTMYHKSLTHTLWRPRP
jgi:hypothetical protein